MSKMITILLSKKERDLVDQYGYPFDEISEQLKKHEHSSKPEVIVADEYWVGHLLGDLSRSINHGQIPEESTMLAVNDIADRIEAALGI